MKTTIIIIVCLLLSAGMTYAETVNKNGDDNIVRHIAEPGQTLDEILPNMVIDYEQIDIDPGEAPEGDYIAWMSFTPDGERVLVTNRVTNNITVFDNETMGVITNIDVGTAPGAIKCSDDYAVVACGFADSVFVIDLDDYSIAGTFETGEQPWVVRINQAGTKAFIACDITNTLEIINLETMTLERTIFGFPIWLQSWTSNSENGRNGFKFSGFELTHDGQYIVVTDGENSVLFYNTETGEIDHTVSGFSEGRVVGISGDGSKAVLLCYGDPMVAHQIDLTTHEITESVSITGYGLSTYEVSVNQDGSKAFIGVQSNASALVRFETSDFLIFTDTYTPFWIGTSPDNRYAIGGQYRFSIIDFETESVAGQYYGNSQYVGDVSKTGFRAVGADPYRHEGIYFYDYEDGFPDYLGTTVSGRGPEGDAPRRVAITPDGTKAIATNVLSDNVTIINLESYEIEAIIPIGDRVQNVEITSDSRWATVCGFNSNSLVVIELDTIGIVADVYAGSRTGVVTLAPDDTYAYVGNISANTVSVIELDGANSNKITDIPCGTIGVIWAGYGVSSDVEYSPNGEYVLVAASFDDQVHVIDTDDMEIVASLTTGDFPIQIAFNSDGQYAIVTNYFSNNFTLMQIDGENSEVLGTYSCGDGPLRVAYNEVDDEFGIGLYSDKQIVYVTPENGDIVGRDYYTTYGALLQLDFDEHGEPLVLTMSDGTFPGHFHRGDEVIELPAVPTYFDYSFESQRAVVVMPGPDWMTLIEWDATGISDAHTIDVSLPDNYRIALVYPNPFNSSTNIEYLLTNAANISLEVYNTLGELVTTLAEDYKHAGKHNITWDASGYSSGVYHIRLNANGLTSSKRIVLVK